jgi:hypothetical protein
MHGSIYTSGAWLMASNFTCNSSDLPEEGGDNFLSTLHHPANMDRQALQNSLKLEGCSFFTETGAPVGKPRMSGRTMRKSKGEG